MAKRAHRYCLDCSYPLLGVKASQCPECGRLFDPRDPSTYSPEPDRELLGRLPRNPLPRELPNLAPGQYGPLTLAFLLAAGLVFRFIEFLPAHYLFLLPLYPVWQFAVVWIVISLAPEDVFSGLMFRTGAGMGAGMLTGLFLTPYGMLTGLVIGLMAGFIQSHQMDY